MKPTRRAVLLAPLALAVPAAAQGPGVYAALLAEEHAAIHLYGVLAPHLPESLREVARAAYDDHRRHRDRLAELIRAAGGTPQPARPSYALPGSVSTAKAARDIAIGIEDSLALRWHAAVGEVAPRERALCVAALGDEAEHLTYLRWSATGRAELAAPDFPGR
ncbi:MAG TPA: DUF4439 domain-containing protein [Frankiaceae bacterium]|nr:DUF4439 domain-containing protein [Frankiaceae bacterium]